MALDNTIKNREFNYENILTKVFYFVFFSHDLWVSVCLEIHNKRALFENYLAG